MLCDTGCSITSFAIEEGRVVTVFEICTAKSSIITIGRSSNVRGRSPVLLIEHKDCSKFDVKLYQDLVSSPDVLTLPRLRFSLCSTDLQTILQASDLTARLSKHGLGRLIDDNTSHPKWVRRTHALLGQSVVSSIFSDRYPNDDFFVVNQQHPLTDWVTLHGETLKLLEQINLPESFDEWEDDDNIGQNDGEGDD